MKTKTLLIAAAALAVGVISSEAQVYSQNVVGYVNQTIPAGGYQIIGSQLIGGSDVNQTNGDVNTTLINGLVSSPVPATAGNPGQDPALSTNSQMIYWNGSGFTTYYYFNQADATAWEGAASPAGWYLPSGAQSTVQLKNGHSTFVYNHSGIPMTVTTTGNVFQGTNVIVTALNAGYNLINLVVPIATNVVVDAAGNALPYGLPLNMTSSPTDPPTLAKQDALIYWNGTGYTTFYYFNQADATTWEGSPSFAGFYLPSGAAMAVQPQVNQGFFLWHVGASINWTNSFTVQ